MQRIPTVLSLILLLVPVAQATSDEVSAQFSSPFQAEGDATIGAQWVIIEFDQTSAGQLAYDSDDSQARIDYHNTTSVSHDLRGRQEYDLPPTEEGLDTLLTPFGMSWASVGSVGILAEKVELTLRGVAVEFRSLPPGSLDDLDDGRGLDDAVSTWVAGANGINVFGQAVKPGELSVSARGVRAIELLGASIECVNSCPTGGAFSQQTIGDTTIERANFERITGVSGAILGTANPMRVRLGGSSLDVSLVGALRLPRAMIADCDCFDGQSTLSLSGSVDLTGIVASDGDRMSAQISGESVRAFRDESEIVIPNLAKAVAISSVGLVVAAVALKLVILPLFTRLSKQEALEHPKRQKIFGYVQEHPGANFREIARNTGIASGTVRHHLTVLERAGHLVEHQHEGTVRLFENHGKFDHNWADVVLLREPPLAQVHDWLKQHSASPQKNILEAFEQQGWSRSTTQHRLARLVEGGLVSIRLQGRLKIYNVVERPAPKATLATPSFPRLLAG